MNFPKWLKSPDPEVEIWKEAAKSAYNSANYWCARAQQAELRLVELGEPVENMVISSTSSYRGQGTFIASSNNSKE